MLNNSDYFILLVFQKCTLNIWSLLPKCSIFCSAKSLPHKFSLCITPISAESKKLPLEKKYRTGFCESKVNPKYFKYCGFISQYLCIQIQALYFINLFHFVLCFLWVPRCGAAEGQAGTRLAASWTTMSQYLKVFTVLTDTQWI